MYELFYNFLIEELLVRYLNKYSIEPGDKFYIVMEDADLRKGFYEALCKSDSTKNVEICFPG